MAQVGLTHVVQARGQWVAASHVDELSLVAFLVGLVCHEDVALGRWELFLGDHPCVLHHLVEVGVLDLGIAEADHQPASPRVVLLECLGQSLAEQLVFGVALGTGIADHVALDSVVAERFLA